MLISLGLQATTMGAPVDSISAVVFPALALPFDTQVLRQALSPAGAILPANYATTAEGASIGTPSVEILVDGVARGPEALDQTHPAGAVISIAIGVTDSAGNVRVFGLGPVTVQADECENTLAPVLTWPGTAVDIGETITLDPGDWVSSSGGTDFEFLAVWRRDGVVVQEGAALSYATTVLDANRILSVTLAARRPGGTFSDPVPAANEAIVVDPIAPPAAMAPAQWSLADAPSAGGDRLRITILEAPASNGAAVVGFEWELNASGLWRALAAEQGSYVVTVPAGAAATIRLRAVNIMGAAAPSDAKTATPSMLSGANFVELHSWGSAMGVTVSLDRTVPTGTFADGSVWAASGGAPLGITGFSLPAQQLARTLTAGGNPGTTTTWAHGAQVNPGRAASGATLGQRQVVNYGIGTATGGGQGYDQLNANDVENNYVDALNVDPGRTGQPIVLTEGTVVKAVSFVTSADLGAGRPVLDQLMALTVLPTVPPADAFRPGLADPDKTVRWRVSDLRMSLLNNFPAGTLGTTFPTALEAIQTLSTVPTFQHTYNSNSRNIVALNGKDAFNREAAQMKVNAYFGTYAQTIANAMVALHFDAWTPAEKLEVVKRLVQMGIDVAARIEQGGVFFANGGHSNGRLFLVAFAAEMLNDASLRATVGRVTEAPTYTQDKAFVGQRVFADIQQTGYLTQTEIDQSQGFVTATGRSLAYRQDQLGWPRFGVEEDRNPAPAEMLGNLTSSGGSHPVTGNAPRGDYMHIACKSLATFCLATRLTPGMAAVIDAPAMLHWGDRYMDWWINGALPTNTNLTGTDLRPSATNAVTPWVRQAWIERRGTDGLWQSAGGGGGGDDTFIFVDMGQSGRAYCNETASFYNPSGYTRPALGQEVGRFVGMSSSSDASINGVSLGNGLLDRAVNDTTYAARQINRGVAEVLRWLKWLHPEKTFVYVDLATSGTGIADLMDNANTTRKHVNQRAILDHVEATYGSPDAVIVSWYGNDGATFASYRREWMPYWTGTRLDGTTHPLGTPNPASTRNPNTPVDVCWYDATVAPNQRGRGDVTRATKIAHVMHPNPAITPASRAEFAAFHSDPRIAPASLGSDHFQPMSGHAEPNNEWEQPLVSILTLGSALVRALGRPYQPPRVLSVSAPADGSYADVRVSLPNGGNLTTIRAQNGIAMPAAPDPRHLPVYGFELARNGTTVANRSRLRRMDSAEAANLRADVAITDPGAGSGAERVATVRITPAVPFATGDRLCHMMGDRADNPVQAEQPFFSLLVEEVPSLRQPGQKFTFPGFLVASSDEALTITLGAAPPPPPPPPPPPATADWNIEGAAGAVTIMDRPAVAAPSITGGAGQVTVNG